MLYSFFRVVVRFSLKIYFRKIELSGLEHVKPGTAQILASNHPSGFLEPLIMACFFPRSLYFLVRGDVFENKFLKPVLVATHQLPIYRFKDGFSKLRENRSSLQAASQVLLDKKCILIFAEGSTKSIKMLRPLQKGFIRLASDTQQQNQDLDIEILPVGINFSDSTKFKSKVMLRIGKPILVDKKQILSDNPDSGEYTGKLIQSVYDAMKKNIIHLADQTRLKSMETAFLLDEIVHDEKLLPTVNPDDKKLEHYKKLAEKINSLEEENYHSFREESKSFIHELKQIGYSLEDLMKRKPDLLSYIYLFLGILPALTGILIHLLPLTAAYLFTVKNVKSKEFFGSIWFVSSIVLLLILYFVLIALTFTGHVSLYFIPLAALSGYFSSYFYLFMRRYDWTMSKTRHFYAAKAKTLYKTYFIGL